MAWHHPRTAGRPFMLPFNHGTAGSLNYSISTSRLLSVFPEQKNPSPQIGLAAPRLMDFVAADSGVYKFAVDNPTKLWREKANVNKS